MLMRFRKGSETAPKPEMPLSGVRTAKPKMPWLGIHLRSNFLFQSEILPLLMSEESLMSITESI